MKTTALANWTRAAVFVMVGPCAIAETPQRPQPLKLPAHEMPQVPIDEATGPAVATAGEGRIVTGAMPAAVSPPETLAYSGTSPVLLIKDGGTNKGLESLITNSKNNSSAVYGETDGGGAGIAGYNGGTTGPAAKFYVTNSTSAQSAVFATTSGTGSAVFATITNIASDTPVIHGKNLGDLTDGGAGYGVEGDGGQVGVYGYSPYNGGVVGQVGLRGTGVTGLSHAGYGVVGGDDGSGIGVYGYSATGIAGYFLGKVEIYGSLTVNDINVSSDRNLKDGLTPLDTRDVLARIRDLSINSWYYKTDQTKRHVGPMAQDFHKAFGLDGDDDTHINVVDAAGISLAAIQELGKQLDDQKARLVQLDADLRQKDARNARLEAQVSAQARVLADLESLTRTFAARVSVLEHERKAETLHALLIRPGTPATQ